MRHVIILPDLGQTTSEARILQLLKRAGEPVRRGEPIVAVSTDKVDMEVESFENGYLREWLVEEGAVATALSALAILTDTPEELYELPADATAQAKAPPTPGAPVPERKNAQVIAAPAARALAKELGLDLKRLTGTGAAGLITKADVQRYTEQIGKSEIMDTRPLTAMAATAVASKRDIPHFYATLDVSMTRATEWRTQWNKAHPSLHATWNDLFVRSAAQSLRDVPRMNVSYRDGAYQQRSVADVLLVIAREPAMVLAPMADPSDLPWDRYLGAIRMATEKGSTIGTEPRLAISNLGMFGVKQFAAIIPPGCTAVLAIGAVREEPVARNGQVEIGHVCSLTLSADHRVVDGVTAARFLERIQIHLNSL
jgi:pyruvate dehydrogenase E2 component (dihydrolipoamide acetyltransferase)